MDPSVHLTENEVVLLFIDFLKQDGWCILSHALDRTHGIDIKAEKGSEVLLVEAKGARGNPLDKNVVRSKFDSGQIKDHLGKAIVKILELKAQHAVLKKTTRLLILHPATPEIQKILHPISSYLVSAGIELAFINKNSTVDWKR